MPRLLQPGGGNAHTQGMLVLGVRAWSLDSIQCSPLGGLKAARPFECQMGASFRFRDTRGWGRGPRTSLGV